MIERRPRAPVSRSSALSAIDVERVVGEDELDAVEGEEALELLDERVARLGEDRDEVVARELVDGAHDRQAADELGDQPVVDEVLGQALLEDLARCPARTCDSIAAPKPTPLWPMRRSMTLSRLANAPPQMNRTFVVSIVRNSWCGCLRPPCGGTLAVRPLEDLQQRLLDALAGHVARDRRVVGLARDLVDLVDVDDPRLGLLDVVVGGLDQLEEDVLDVLADVAGLGQRRGVGDRERDVEDARERLGEQRLAAAGRAEQQDVRLLQLDVARRRPASSARACSGCRPRRRACAWPASWPTTYSSRTP